MRMDTRCMALLWLIVALGLGGCTDSGDMKDVELVSALAVDRDAGGVTAAVQLLQRDKALEPQYAESYYMLKAADRDLAGALGELYRNGARQLNFTHTTLLLLGEAAAGVEDWLDNALRSPELRPTVYPVIAEGEAAELLAAEELPQAAVYMLGSILEPKVSGEPGYAAVTLQEFVTGLRQPGKAAVLPCVAQTEDGVRLSGFMVYDEGQPAAKLDGDAALGWMLLQRSDHLRGVTLSLGQDVVLEMQKAEVFAAVSRDAAADGIDGIEVCFRLRCRVDVVENPRGVADDEMRLLAKQRLREALTAALDKSRELGLDFPGIGCEIYRKLPDEWAAMDNQEQEYINQEYLDAVDCRWDVDVEVSQGS